MIHRLLIVLVLVPAMTAVAGERTTSRVVLSLNGTWQVGDSISGREPPASFEHAVPVPGLANLASPPFSDVDRFISRELAHHPWFRPKDLPAAALDAPVGIPLQQRKYFWYRKSFTPPVRREIAILKINKAQFGTAVWLNGEKVGEHMGCFTAGYFDVTGAIHWNSENRLVIRIGAHPAVLPPSIPAGTDLEKLKWTPGIYDDVFLFLADNPVIETVQVAPRIASSEIIVETRVKNYGDKRRTFGITQRVKAWNEDLDAGEAQPERLTLDPGEEQTRTQTVRIRHPRLWTPESPYLYVVETGTEGDGVATRFGMREFRFDAASGCAYLNGKRYYLRGSNVTLHRFFEDPNCGALPWNEEWVRKLLVEIPKRMHWNSFRFCIGPVPDRWLEIADEAGLLIQNEFFIWTFPGWHKEWEPELPRQFQEWMRDNWNHPSIAIWDSSNETKAPVLGGRIIPAVRPLDLSHRPWENGWNPASAPDDPVEQHNYILTPRFKWTDLERAPRDKAGQSPHPRIVNEYGELWLNRDGSPTVLTKKTYDAMLGPDATAEQRFAANAYLLAGLTEYWRAHRRYAGILHFVYLTASFPGAYTSDHFRDVRKLALDPYFEDYVGEAFKPLGVYLNFWQPALKAGSTRRFKIMMVNDDSAEANGKLILSIETDAGETLARADTGFSIAAVGQRTYELDLTIPKIGGKCLLTAAAFVDSDRHRSPTLSRRKVSVVAD